jgi:hypothetical protein
MLDPPRMPDQEKSESCKTGTQETSKFVFEISHVGSTDQPREREVALWMQSFSLVLVAENGALSEAYAAAIRRILNVRNFNQLLDWRLMRPIKPLQLFLS